MEFIRQAFVTYLEPLYLSGVDAFSAVQAEAIRLYRSKDPIAILRDVRTVNFSIVLGTASVGQPVAVGLIKGNIDRPGIVEGLVQECRTSSRGTAGAGKIPTCGGLLRPVVIVSQPTKWHSDLARTHPAGLLAGRDAFNGHDSDLDYQPARPDGSKFHR